jgi:hypothetical protein
LNAFKDARGCVGSGYDVHDLRVEEIAGGCNIASKNILKKVFGHRDAGIRHVSNPSTSST